MKETDPKNNVGVTIFDTAPSFEIIDELCKESLLTLSVCGGYITNRPIYNKAGVLLLEKDETLDSDKRDLLLQHELRDRFLNCVVLENEIVLDHIPEEIDDLFTAYLSDLKGDFSAAMHEMNALLQDTEFSSATQTSFTLLKERHPLGYHHAFLTALIMTQMAVLLGDDSQKKVELFAAGLFHHLGYGILEDPTQGSAFLNLNPTEEQEKIIRVHPLWTYKLLQSLNQIVQEDDSDAFIFPDRTLAGVLHHHRGADGVAGYGGVGIPNDTARMLYVVDTFTVLLQTGLTTQDALTMIIKHEGKASVPGHPHQPPRVYSTQRGDTADDLPRLFDERYTSLLSFIFTRSIHIPVQKPISISVEISPDYIHQLFLDFNRLVRELREMKENISNDLVLLKNNDGEMRALKPIRTSIQKMILAVLKESGLFSAQIDQLQIVGNDQVSKFVAMIQPVCYQLELTITEINNTLDDLLAQREKRNEKSAELSVIKSLSHRLSKTVSEIYDRFIKETKSRRLENLA